MIMDLKSLIPFGRSSSPVRIGSEMDPVNSLRREMDRMLEDFTRGWNLPQAGAAFQTPRVDVAETEKGLEITAELPGMAPEDITLDVADGVLTLQAERKAENETKDEKKQYHLVERSYGKYLRRFALPFQAANDQIEAKFDKGVLHIAIPRPPQAEAAASRIAIKSG